MDNKRATGQLLGIVGPTATGKTGLSLRLAQTSGADILCVDSRTIYRGMDIGTAKPTSAEQNKVCHYGLDLIEPGYRFSAYDFCEYARPIVEDYLYNGKKLILVGGSGMYFDALIFGYKFRRDNGFALSTELLSDVEVLQAVEQTYTELIGSYDVRNTRRLRQLLEKGPVKSNDRNSLNYPIKIVGLSVKPDKHRTIIAERTEKMLKQGFVQEVKFLINNYGIGCSQLYTTGYRAVRSYLEGTLPRTQLAQVINRQTWQLVRKQRTWFGRNTYIEWVDPSNPQVFTRLLTLFQ